MKQRPHPDIYQFKRECLAEFESLSEKGAIDLFYGDESGVSLTPCIPYAWQFSDEDYSSPSQQGGNLNCFALINRDNRCLAKLSREPITADWICNELESFSLSLQRQTVIVLDNARIHSAKIVKERFRVWQERGLFIFYLPPYSPQLNIAEILWRKLKYEWLCAEDYAEKETLYYAVWQALSAVGRSLRIQFSQFKAGLT